MRAQAGAASVEWVALLLVVSVGLGGVLAASPGVDGRSFAGFLAHTITCAARRDCDEVGDPALVAAYGAADAELLRRHAPSLAYEPGERSLPIDWRQCRVRRCSRAPDRAGLDAHVSDAGLRATAFTHVVRRGGETFLQYWFYYPYSNTTIGNAREGIGARELPGDGGESALSLLGSVAGVAFSPTPAKVTDEVRKRLEPDRDKHPARVAQMPKWWPRVPLPARAIAWQLSDGRMGSPGFHHDDWEGYQVRIDAAGRATARASSHGRWQWCKSGCRGRWGEETGWSRVSFGSHAGHVPVRGSGASARGLRPGLARGERSSTGAGLRLVPIESLDVGAYRPRDESIEPPWQKRAYRDPADDRS